MLSILFLVVNVKFNMLDPLPLRLGQGLTIIRVG